MPAAPATTPSRARKDDASSVTAVRSTPWSLTYRSTGPAQPDAEAANPRRSSLTRAHTLTVLDSNPGGPLAENSTMWHYTDAAGLLGILGSNPEQRDPSVVGPQSCQPSFRATAVQYLNDSRELIHGLEIIKNEVLLKRAAELDAIDYQPNEYHEIANAPAKAKFLRALCETIEQVETRTYDHHIHCYITSFSKNPDALSQWRGYCGGLDGFTIGIDRDKISETPETLVREVSYSDSLPTSSMVTGNVNDWLNRRLSSTHAPETTSGMLNHCVRELSASATQLKHQGFTEEAEWRVIHLGYSKGASYRNRGAQLIPYATWSVPADAVVGVRVGPGPNQQENYLAAKGALYSFGYAEVAEKLTKSPTPFR